MEKKSKLLTIVLTIYLTIVTIGCALFGYLYFSNLNKQQEKLDLFSAKVLINQVCEDLGLLKSNTNNELSATSKVPQPYVGTKVDDKLVNAFSNFQMGCLIFKCLLDDSSVVENEYYRYSDNSNGKHHEVITFDISGNRINVKSYSADEEKGQQSSETLSKGNSVIFVEKTKTGWKGGCDNVYDYGTGIQQVYSRYVYDNSKGMTYVNFEQVELDEKANPLPDKITEDIFGRCIIMDCDVSTQKILYAYYKDKYSSYDGIDLPETVNPQYLTLDEALEVSNECYNKIKKEIKLYSGSELANMDCLENDFYERLMK